MVLEGYPLENHQKNRIICNISNRLKERQWKKFVAYREIYDSSEMDSIERGNAYTNMYNYFSQCLFHIVNNQTIKDGELKKHILPSKLGNVFKYMEIYPEWKYGMNGIFYWTRIQLLLSEDNKTTLEKTRAFADLFIELTWIFLFAAISYFIVLLYCKNYMLSFVLGIIFLIISYVSYNMAVQSALNFGLYVRSIFDLYRGELWDKLKNGQFSILDSFSEKERWNKIFRCLWLYKTIPCQNCGEFHDIAIEHKCDILEK